MNPKFKAGDVVLYKGITYWAVLKIQEIKNSDYCFLLMKENAKVFIKSPAEYTERIFNIDIHSTLYKPMNKPKYLK